MTFSEFFEFLSRKYIEFTDREIIILNCMMWAKKSTYRKTRYKEIISNCKNPSHTYLKETKYKLTFDTKLGRITIYKFDDEYYIIRIEKGSWPYSDKFRLCDQWNGLLESILTI